MDDSPAASASTTGPPEPPQRYGDQRETDKRIKRGVWLPKIANGVAVTSDGHEYGHAPDGSLRRVDPIARLKSKKQRRQFRAALKVEMAKRQELGAEMAKRQESASVA